MPCDRVLLAVQRCCVISRRTVKDRFRPSLVATTGAGKTFQERLNEFSKSSDDKTERINIGLLPFQSAQEKKEPATKFKYQDKKQSRLPVLREIASDWLADNGPLEICKIADHYDIFNHLFGDAFFFPQFQWQIAYGGEKAVNVLFGNRIAADTCLERPHVTFDSSISSDDSTHWCLVMTALDGHLTNSNNEYLLWMAANLPSGASDPISKADIVVPYLPPFPPSGLGLCRIAFVLYKQHAGRIAQPQEMLATSSMSADLKSRDFSTLNWYKKRQDLLTPASLRFFQTQWDDSVTGTYHDILDMKEPRYKYMTPEPYREEQLVRPPEDVPFNEYLDRYRDRKDIAEEVLKYQIYSSNSPIGKQQPSSKYPNLKRFNPGKVVSWIRDEEKNKNLRVGKWKALPPPL